MDGRQALAGLRAIDDQTPVVICSGYGYVNISEQFESAPPAGFLQKPYTMKTLKETVYHFSNNSIGGN
jgi:FixJ family two-component response regulator